MERSQPSSQNMILTNNEYSTALDLGFPAPEVSEIDFCCLEASYYMTFCYSIMKRRQNIFTQ